VGCAAAASTQPGQLLICEGIPDALIAAQAGYRSVGLLGTNALDPTVAARIANVATRDNLDITIITDNDDNGVGKHLGQQLSFGLRVQGCIAGVLEPPDGHDLSTWASHEGRWSDRLAAWSDGRPCESQRLGVGQRVDTVS
jgi:DNA primase